MNETYFKQYLIETYQDHLADKSSTGVDGTSSKQFRENIDEEIDIITRKVNNGTYQFSLYKEKLILKGRGAHPRAISIPTNRDKLLLKVLHHQLTLTYQDELENDSIHSKIRNIKQHIDTGKYNSFIKMDIESFFPNIDHDILLALLEKKLMNKNDLSLIKQAIKQSTASMGENNREKHGNDKGVPQGLSISGLLATIYLSAIDNKHNQGSKYHYYRFVDDILVLCHHRDIDFICQELVNDMKAIGLTTHEFDINSPKSSYGYLNEGVQFLGYQFIGSLISVRPSSVDKIYNGINKMFLQFHKHAEEEDLDYLYKRLNLKITGCLAGDKQYGWLFFFSFINDKNLLFKLDSHVKRSCRRFKVPYDIDKIKKFSRTYYELRKIEKSNYIPKFGNKNNLEEFKNCSNITLIQKEKDYITGEILADIESDIEFY